MQERSLGRTIWNLVLALVNATLILVILCLYLGLRLTDRVHSITKDFAASLISLEPVKEEVRGMSTEIQGMTREIAALRSDLGELREGGQELSSQALENVSDRLDAMSARVNAATSGIEEIIAHPEVLVETAIDKAAEEVKEGVSQMWGCFPSGEPLS
ncbi:hypothetical protein [Pseudooceanicola sp. HF7]|uniref:hypothetical protein n=1 Tax=Pseudooceanicola sp. HF7 TaxID=2721560 RepID=UPI001430CBDC|nr:hypothetical protein [Pseudooceanicola sp. HF7]NIZ09922.1 hypothetical protein [Pseudooceanicola sp. HF7]